MLMIIWLTKFIWMQVIVFGSLYAKNLLNNKKSQSQPPPPELPQYEKAEGSWDGTFTAS